MEGLLEDIGTITDGAQAKPLTVAQLALALAKNYRPEKAPPGYNFLELLKQLLSQTGARGKKIGEYESDAAEFEWRVLFVAGQVGWDPSTGGFESDDLVEQLGRALDNVLAVVGAAGGTASCIARMTVYVTDLDAYRKSTRAIGGAWRARLGKHFPAMALVGVAGLVERRAKIEIEATCVLPPFSENG